MNLIEIILPNRPPKNPQPCLFQGGDCGACALAGVLGITVPEAYELHETGYYHDGSRIEKIHSFNFNSMRETLRMLSLGIETESSTNLLHHTVLAVPLFPFHHHYELTGLAFGLPGHAQWAWKDYVIAMLSAGYYGITQVEHGGYSEMPNLNEYGTTNHWVTIAGYRTRFISNPERGGGKYEEELLILDSSVARPLEMWICYGKFLKFWGGFSALWAKPAKKI